MHHCVEDEIYKFHPKVKFGDETPNSKMDRYNAALKALAADQKFDLADFNAVTGKAKQSDYLSKDGVHLTPAGNKLLARRSSMSSRRG